MAFWTCLRTYVTHCWHARNCWRKQPPYPPFLQLPNELFYEILSYLDTSDQACLCLCNRALYHKLADVRASGSIRYRGYPYEIKREAFLARVAKDKPKLFFCHDCRRLHRCGMVPAPGLVGRRQYGKSVLQCVVKPDFMRQLYRPFKVHGDLPYYIFKFQHLYLAMLRHRLDSKYGIRLEMLSMIEVRRSWNYKTTALTTTLLSVEPKIVQDELHLWVQQRIAVDSDDLSTITDRALFRIWSHINGYRTAHQMSDLLRCRLNVATANLFVQHAITF